MEFMLYLWKMVCLCAHRRRTNEEPVSACHFSADGQFEVTLVTKATLYYTGLIVWEPPAIYKSACIMNVEFFPFDIQHCALKFGSWTYDGFEIDLVHVCAEDPESTKIVQHGIDLTDFYQNVEWDVVSVTAQKNIKLYICCIEPYPDITFNITMRRKTLFHTVNLILPCVAISFMTILVFYLPSESEEKITLCISILLSLTVFFLLLTEIIPPTSIVIPLIGKYLLFTMVLVTLSILVTVFIITIHFRSPSTHHMSPWIRHMFLQVLPGLLRMRRPKNNRKSFKKSNHVKRQVNKSRDHEEMRAIGCEENHVTVSPPRSPAAGTESGALRDLPHTVQNVLSDVNFIADHLKEEDSSSSMIDDWKFVAMVLDRMFFWVFTSASVIGTFGILLQAPTIYDDRVPLTADSAMDALC